MSGPLEDADARLVPDCGVAGPPEIEISADRQAEVGRVQVRRALPQRTRRTVGPWCFADHFGPANVTSEHGFDIGPHPHMGLATVTWLFEGEVLHRDSLGSEQPIRPGELNLMTAGHGISHSEEGSGKYSGTLEGIQLWLAQPEAGRHGQAAFAHHANLPELEVGSADATVLVGSFAGAASPATFAWPTCGTELLLRGGGAEIPLDTAWEYAVVVASGRVELGGQSVTAGVLGYLGAGRDELRLVASEPSRVMLLGGLPFGERIVMWWNFVARSTEELEAAYRSWLTDDSRFGVVASPLARIAAPAPYWQR
ncbi:MAG: pirin family protein [Mycobacteriales bacterium]